LQLAESVQDFCWLTTEFSLDGLLISALAAHRIRLRSRQKALNDWEKFIMQWTAPAFEEVCLNCEINSYVSAKL
jgi:coenzyme PQQ precursor peptide PqqA